MGGAEAGAGPGAGEAAGAGAGLVTNVASGVNAGAAAGPAAATCGAPSAMIRASIAATPGARRLADRYASTEFVATLIILSGSRLWGKAGAPCHSSPPLMTPVETGSSSRPPPSPLTLSGNWQSGCGQSYCLPSCRMKPTSFCSTACLLPVGSMPGMVSMPQLPVPPRETFCTRPSARG